jgi:uncharacterized protein
MPELVHLASGWYDVCLPSVLADYRALRDAGKWVRLVVGPWYHGRGAITSLAVSESESPPDTDRRPER